MTWKWIAYYSDGTTLEQGPNQYEKIDRSRLAAFGIEMDGILHYKLFLEEGQKLIYRHKGFIEMSGLVQTNLPGYFMIGYQESVNGKNRQCITYIDEETGLIQTAGRFVEGSEPIFRKEEKIDG